MAEKEQRRAEIKLTRVDDLFVTEESRQESAREKVLELRLRRSAISGSIRLR